MSAAHTDHGVPGGSRKPVAIALAITSIVLVVEAAGGILTGSLALLADAGHMVTDVAALALALFAGWLAARPATPERSFGFRRAEILAALINAVSLIAVSFYILWEGIARLDEPPRIESGPMLAVAVAGLVANVASAWVLTRGDQHRHDLNARAALLHVIGDLLGSVGAVAAAAVMLVTGWYRADPILSLGIGLLILWNAWSVLREAVDVLLEATPRGLSAAAVHEEMEALDGVVAVHDLHIWTVTSGFLSLSAHVELDEGHVWNGVLAELTAMLRDRFGIAHVTLQPEEPGAGAARLPGCPRDTPTGRDSRRALPPTPPGGHGH